MKWLIYRGLFLVLMVVPPALANDATPGEVRKVEVVPANGEVRVEVTLSSAITPAVETAQHPDRLVLKLPGTVSGAQQKQIWVRQLGVRSIRYGLNRPNPPETHLVVDLDQEHSYKLSTDGNKVILIIEAPLSGLAKQRKPPAAAASKPMITALGSGSSSDISQSGSQSGQDAVLLTPPPSGPPIDFPTASGDAQGTSRSASSSGQPSAERPNRAGLQEGTVFPSQGAPGAGVVPPVAGSPSNTGFDAKNTQNSANANVPSESAKTALPQDAMSSTNASSKPAASVRQEPTNLPQSSGQNAAAMTAQNATSPSTAVPGQAAPPAQNAAPAEIAQPTPVVTANPTEVPVESVASDQTPPPVQEAAAEPAGGEGSGAGRVPQLIVRQGDNPDFRTAFRVKYVAEDAAYLDGGRAAGLAEGMKLVVRDLPNAGAVATTGSDSEAAGDVAELVVLSVAETSAVTEIHTPKRPVKVGDLAYLSSADQQALVEKNALSATRKYPAVVSFTENDTLDDEAREEVPKPPLPSVNRARGRIGFDYIGVLDHGGSGMQSSNLGMVLRADITRINGTYWNMSGYWRGRLDRTSAGPQTLQDTINRTYHLFTTYDNPRSAWVAGFGRMYLPWATSLDTIDGGYFGRKLAKGVTSGVFLGSTPDPTSYGYAPNREIGGAFINFEGGDYDAFHYTSTTGGGLNLLKWSVDRPFAFFENTLFYKRYFSIYQATQIDNKQGYWYFDSTKNANVWQPGTSWGPGRSFTTLRFQPHPRVEFSLNHTYFRDLPTFDPSLIATGLLDKFLFQGFSGGARVEVLKQVWISSDTGLSNRTGDKNNSLNEMVGLTFGHLPWIGVHTDLRYSRFNSSFGSGSYEAVAVSKNLGDDFQLQLLAGQQNFNSTLTSANRSRFLNGMLEKSLGQHYFVQAGGTISRGGVMNYDQWIFTFGYRFDNRHGHQGQ